MGGITAKLARACSAHPWRTIAAWIVALVLAGVAAATLLGGNLTTTGRETNNPQSERASTAIEHAFPPDPSRASGDVVLVRSSQYEIGDAQFRAFVNRAAAEVRKTGVVSGGRTYYQVRDPSLVSADRHATLVPFSVDAGDADKVVAVVKRLDADPAFQVAATGNGITDNDFNTLSQEDLRKGELGFGAPGALIVLVLVFGSVVAGLVPLLVAILSIAVALGLVAVYASFSELSVFVINMLTGMGLALGIDYSLFVISRYREERGRGLEKYDAIGAAGATASRSVLFSGTTFVVAMFGMFLVPASVMRSLAVGAIAVGIVSVVAALTLLPAMLGLLGDRVNALRVPFIGRRQVEGSDTEGRFWRAVIERVMRRPGICLAVAVVLLLAVATPVLGMKVGSNGVSTLPDRFPSKQGFEALVRSFPRASTNPVEVVVAKGGSSEKARSALASVRSTLAKDPRFGPGVIRTAGGVTVLTAPVGGDAAGPRAVGAVRELRGTIVPEAFSGTGATVYVGGKTSENVDYFDGVTNPAPYVFLFVLGLTLIFLTVVFRSIVAASVAVLLNLLSVGAAYGLLVLVFQHGFATGLLGFQQADTIEAWVPLFLFSVLFGLSMDYQVFLLSRIKERYDASGDPVDSVLHGVASTARIITGAAVIIVVVFLGFAMGDLIQFQQMGFGVAVALLLDATVIRSVVLPAAMRLLGRWNWYLPSWLAWLPRLDVEGPAAPESRPAPRLEAG